MRVCAYETVVKEESIINKMLEIFFNKYYALWNCWIKLNIKYLQVYNYFTYVRIHSSNLIITCLRIIKVLKWNFSLTNLKVRGHYLKKRHHLFYQFQIYPIKYFENKYLCVKIFKKTIYKNIYIYIYIYKSISKSRIWIIMQLSRLYVTFVRR